MTATSMMKDPVGAEVHRKALENLANDMGLTLVRTSGSPSTTDAKDFSTCLLDASGEPLAMSSSMLAHSASSLLGTNAVIDALAAAGQTPRPGDGWLVNDPHRCGALHQADVGVVTPIFRTDQGDDLVGWAFSNVHLLDVGGSGVSGIAPSALSMYEEGLRLPAVRAIRDNRLDEVWAGYIAANVRAPEAAMNDIRSMLAANNTGVQTMRRIIDAYGAERHHEFAGIGKDLTENLLRARIASLPDGRYESVEFIEFDGHGVDRLVEVRAAVIVDGSDLRFELRGDPQVDAFVNSGRGSSYGSVMVTILTMLGYGDLPYNAGVWRPLHIDLGEPGSVINPTEPAPVSLGHAEAGTRVTTAVRQALNQALALSADPVVRSRVAGIPNDSTNIAGLFGVADSGAPAVLFYMDGAAGLGGPAQTVGDGQDAFGMSMMSGCGMPDAELYESTDPVLFLWRRLHVNSAGPGQTRGGLGTDRAYVLRGADSVSGFNTTVLRERPAVGTGGGAPASAGNQYPVRQSGVDELMARGVQPLSVEQLAGEIDMIRAKDGRFTLYRHDTFRTIGGGGSGLGDPLLRDPEAVGRDVYDGYLTRGHAEAAYGVVTGDDGVVDTAATVERREQIRARRLGVPPAVPLRPPADPGVSVRPDESHWRCGHCRHPLCDRDGDWRAEGTVTHVEPVADWAAAREMAVYARTAEPRILVTEHYCPNCAAALHTDVLPEGVTYASPRLAPAATMETVR
ncbi:N-methylhydantoinase [Acrocarpospora pleiomorpha]|uniref:N-methylhydantoinase n=1 Tax=Acrocarpospora pleiomorpha TaxID=90975 RepID=A0A5M3XCI6_9ACTN|nr:hydantoinase B/oxoprolinase family protein [Acrocarpospora pleiomorpha]GES19377.1 N-methylhydantoinase [Acrocarpospora pleiomorpha]